MLLILFANNVIISLGVDSLKIYNSIDKLVGNTPLLELVGIENKYNLSSKIYAKLEYLNPTGSIKDRAALQMIVDAEKDGKISVGSTIIEPTSGNTGIGLAAIGISRGYKVIIVMPNTMSLERVKLMSAYGAEVVLSDGAKGMPGAIDKANELQKSIEGSVVMGQFDNPSNVKSHYDTTGPEIFSDTNGNIDCFVCAVGTGGTITGTGMYLKEKIKNVEIIAVEPASSAVLSGQHAGAHKIQGIGAGFIPSILDVSVCDKIVTVTDNDAYMRGSEVAKTDGVMVGISSGAALDSAIKYALKNNENPKNIVVIFPDSGSRYLSLPDYY